jgi:hypothetical protein
MSRPTLLDRNDNPRKVLRQRVEWPIAVLFATIPVLALVALVKNVLLAGAA